MAPTPSEMIADIDLWRAAKLLVDRYGDEAGIEAANRADAMLDKDDLEGKAVWLRTDPRCREELQNTRPAGPVH